MQTRLPGGPDPRRLPRLLTDFRIFLSKKGMGPFLCSQTVKGCVIVRFVAELGISCKYLSVRDLGRRRVGLIRVRY